MHSMYEISVVDNTRLISHDFEAFEREIRNCNSPKIYADFPRQCTFLIAEVGSNEVCIVQLLKFSM